jgi:hypothetical protein
MNGAVWFFLGSLTAFLPCLIVVGILIARSMEGNHHEQ